MSVDETPPSPGAPVGVVIPRAAPRRGRTRERVTIAAVADAADVSPATVSRVMNGHASVDPVLAERVREAAMSLGYAPNATAQSLARGRTGLVGIVVPDLTNPMFQSVLTGLSIAAGEQEHRVLIADSREAPEEEAILVREMRRRCDGLVLCAPRMAEDELQRCLPSLAPLVLVHRWVEHLDVPTVSIDNGGGIRAVADHLVALGHRTVAYLAGPPASSANQERLAALRATAVDRFRLLEFPAGSTFAEGFDVIDQVVATGVTAVVGYNDLVAFGAMARLQALGYNVPGTVSVAGFDDIPFARYANPSLTTVAVPQQSVGREAWRRLAAALTGLPPPADTRYTLELIVRRSTGPAPGG